MRISTFFAGFVSLIIAHGAHAQEQHPVCDPAVVALFKGYASALINTNFLSRKVESQSEEIARNETLLRGRVERDFDIIQDAYFKVIKKNPTLHTTLESWAEKFGPTRNIVLTEAMKNLRDEMNALLPKDYQLQIPEHNNDEGRLLVAGETSVDLSWIRVGTEPYLGSKISISVGASMPSGASFQSFRLIWNISDPRSKKQEKREVPEGLAESEPGYEDLVKIVKLVDACKQDKHPVPSAFEEFPAVAKIVESEKVRSGLQQKLKSFVQEAK